MLKPLATLLLLFALSLAPSFGQAAPPRDAVSGDPWQALKFLEGTWEAKTSGAQGVNSAGAYSFVRELNGHIMARHSTTSGTCKGPVTFDCAHTDELIVYQDAPSQPLRAIYFDSEGHTLHYSIATPQEGSVIFLSEPGYGPQVRLLYELKAGVMYGKFQIQPPGATEWKSYLEWSGAKR